MIRQIKAECYKLIKSEFYHRLFVIYIFVSIAVLSMERGTKMGFYLTGYEWFCVRQLMGSLGWMVFSFFVAEYMSSEFTNHGFESALMCGYTRKEIFRVKFIVCMLAFLVLALANAIGGTLVTTILNGFGAQMNGMTIRYMAKRFVYYVLSFIVTDGILSIIFAVMTKSKSATIVLELVIYQLIASTTGRIWYILKDMKNPVWKEAVHGIFEITPLYQIDSLLTPEHFRPHQFWQYLLSCSVCLIGTYLIMISIFKKSDMQ